MGKMLADLYQAKTKLADPNLVLIEWPKPLLCAGGL